MSTSEYPATRFAGPRLARFRELARTRPIPTEVWLLGALIVLAAAIRIITINNQSLWQDEALTAYEARLPLGAMLNTVAHVETTPPLYFVLIWGWAKVFGAGAVALRAVSTIAGIALVPIAYLAAKELVSRWAGVVAAALVAVNPFLIWYSQEARAYMLLAALTGAGFLWFLRARTDPSRRNLLWWVVFSSLAVMTHFFAGFAVAPEALWLLWIHRTRLVALGVGVVAVVQLAMLPFVFIDTSHGVGWIAAISRTRRIAETALEWGVSLLFRRATTLQGLGGAALLIALVVVLLGFAGDRRTREGAAVAAAVAAFIFLVPLALGIVGQDYFISRNVIPAVVPVACVLAAACVVPRARVLGGALALALLAMFSIAAIRVQTHPYLQRPNWRNVAHSLGPTSVPRAILAADGTTADALKIYLPNVTWVQLHSRRFVIDEVDVVGATKRLPLIPTRRQLAAAALRGGRLRTPTGSPVPRVIAPPGATLLMRRRVNNWIVARFALAHPIRVSINQLLVLAPRFFLRTPQSLLVFTQRSGN